MAHVRDAKQPLPSWGSTPALLGRLRRLHDRTVVKAAPPGVAALAERGFLYPAILQHPDVRALVGRVVAREVAVRLELDDRVAAEERLKVAHVGQIGATRGAGRWCLLAVAMVDRWSSASVALWRGCLALVPCEGIEAEKTRCRRMIFCRMGVVA